jgi:hypothetical protein
MIEIGARALALSRSRSIPSGLLGLFLLASCGSGPEGSACIDLGDPGGTIFITIGCGDPRGRPFYEWDMDKPVFSIEVKETETGNSVWLVLASGGEDTIYPPVEHGQFPLGSSEPVAADDLETGVEYRVRVIQLNGETGSQEFMIRDE